MASDPHPALGPYAPTLILHGGAGAVSRANLPPALYAQYEASLAAYVVSARAALRRGASALDAACQAVARMEDDPLFNCGRGSVFSRAGDIEMEASVMVCALDAAWTGEGSVKRGAAVSLLAETRHPVLLARELLREGDGVAVGLGEMHCQRSGRAVEEWGWDLGGGRALERKPRDWFWTRRRWEEHLRGLEREGPGEGEMSGVGVPAKHEHSGTDPSDHDGVPLPSQGTVGCVCMDSWGVLAVATSTGGLTNKQPGRIGDTPTLGAGFWAESWDEDVATIAGPSRAPSAPHPAAGMGPLDLAAEELGSALAACLPRFSRASPLNQPMLLPATVASSPPYTSPSKPFPSRSSRRAVAMSGTGNGDSFLRTCAARSAAAMARFSPTSLNQAVANIAGCGGELQRSAGERWGHTGEGEGGIIGIEAVGVDRRGRLVAEFNCGGMWRAWVDEKTGNAKVMVFREKY